MNERRIGNRVLLPSGGGMCGFGSSNAGGGQGNGHASKAKSPSKLSSNEGENMMAKKEVQMSSKLTEKAFIAILKLKRFLHQSGVVKISAASLVDDVPSLVA
jgi:hypothetical protein